MHPPFYTVDHKIGTDIRHHGGGKPTKRRGLPERLQLTPATTGWPPVALLPGALQDAQIVQLPSGHATAARPMLQIVPPPRRTLREVIGRLLIRTGQRMILSNRLG